LLAYRRSLPGLALMGVIALTGCEGSAPVDPMLYGHTGQDCTVYFRHDALGMAAGVPASPTTGNHNGADTQISGKLLRVNAGWICLAVGNAEYTVPREVILLVEMPAKR
jgi:hypothetical protein